MLLNVEGAVVIITGASSGLGREIALSLSPRNLRLIITGRDQDRLNEVSQLCTSLGKAEVRTFVGDLTSEDICKYYLLHLES